MFIAIKKRSRESVSPPFPESRKLNHTANGVELLRKDRVKKSKLKVGSLFKHIYITFCILLRLVEHLEFDNCMSAAA